MENKSLDYQLGTYAGEYILFMYLPCLSVDEIGTRNIINVSDEDKIEYERLNALWYSNIGEDSSKENFKSLMKFYRKLKFKYLPNVLVCEVPTITIDSTVNVEDLIEGIRTVLWNSDVCNYNIEKNSDVIIDNSSDDKTRILLKLGEN